MATKLYISNEDESARLFKSDFLELFSHVHWSVPLIIYVPVSAYFMYKAATNTVLGAAEIAGWFAFGLFFWTLTEYLLHRFVFHYEPTTEWGKSLIFLFHGVHHAYPNDSLRLVMPPVVSIPLATLFYFLFLAVFGETLTAPFFSGFIVGYLIYDEMHYASHHFPLKSKLGLSIKHHHMKHHYQNESLGYGVSSQLWDYVFGTTFPEKKESH